MIKKLESALNYKVEIVVGVAIFKKQNIFRKAMDWCLVFSVAKDSISTSHKNSLRTIRECLEA